MAAAEAARELPRAVAVVVAVAAAVVVVRRRAQRGVIFKLFCNEICVCVLVNKTRYDGCSGVWCFASGAWRAGVPGVVGLG